MMRVLVTGATGFVGQALCRVLVQSGYRVRTALRSAPTAQNDVNETVVVGNVDADTIWDVALRDVDAVVHLAARAHALEDGRSHRDLYFETNARATRKLADASARVGIRRFIYLSSIKVNGEETNGVCYSVQDSPAPQDAYGMSKWLGETHVLEVAARTGMQATIVRSPLVYGPGVRANFFRLMRWIDREWPLPLGAVTNSRSLVSIWNLCDLLVYLLHSPSAPGRTWMVSDGEDLSTPDLIRRIATVMGRRAKLISVPTGLLNFFGTLTGRRAEIARLCGSLALDIAPTVDELGWSPPVTVNEGLARTVHWYLSEGRLHGT